MSADPAAAVKTIQTRVGPLRVQIEGSGPPAVLWHSLFVDSTTWDRLRPRLIRERRLVLVDGPNHGANARTRQPFSLTDCAGAAVDLLTEMGITEPVDWVGNAWGGHVGLLFAADHPQRCRSLMAIGAPVHALSPEDRRRIRLLSAVYLVGGPAAVGTLLVDALIGRESRTADPHARQLVKQCFARAGRLGMFDATRWLSLRRPDLTPMLDRIDRPSLLTTGRQDPMWTVASARDAAGRLRAGAVVVLPGSGHVGPLLTSAPQLGDLIVDFWSDPAGAVARESSAAPAPAG